MGKTRVRICHRSFYLFAEVTTKPGQFAGPFHGILGYYRIPVKKLPQQHFQLPGAGFIYGAFTQLFKILKPDDATDPLSILIKCPFVAIGVKNIGKRPELVELRFVVPLVTLGISAFAGSFQFHKAAEQFVHGDANVWCAADFLRMRFRLRPDT